MTNTTADAEQGRNLFDVYLDRNPSFADARAEFLFDEHEDEYRERQYEREAGLDR